MDTTNTENSFADARETHQKIAKVLGSVLAITLILFGIWISAKLLFWAIDQRELRSTSIGTSEVTAEVREKQLTCLAKNIYHEAGGEPFEGKVAVAQVTLNRAANGGFPDDICKVIYQKNKVYEKVICQFSWVCEGTGPFRPSNRREYDESIAVAKKVLLEGFRLPSLQNALYFHADYINPGWKRTKVAHIGRHIFYN